MRYNIALLRGDGIGPEIVDSAVRVLEAVAKKFGHEFVFTPYLIGGASIDAYGIPLTDEVRLASYKAAYPHFVHLFEDGIVIFGCSSWLLYPRHREFLPAGMNLLKFMGDFEMVSGKETPDDFHDRWRVFGRYTDLPDDQLPKDTTMRRAYAEWLQAGNPTGRGFGIIAFDGEKILR